MTLNNIDISKSFLLSGENFILFDGLEIKHPSIGEILKLGNGVCCDSVYWHYISTMLCDPYDNMVWLDDIGIDYEDVSPFDIFIMKWNKCVEEYTANPDKYNEFGIHPLDSINESLHFFLGNHIFNIGTYPDNSKGLYDIKNKDIVINSEIFNYIITFIQLINGITHNGRINPANKSAKKILIDDKRDEQKKLLRKQSKVKTNNDYFGNMISAVVNGGNGGITPFNFKELKIYQLYSAMSIEQKKLHFNQIMNGVYQGTVAYDKIDKQELNWTN